MALSPFLLVTRQVTLLDCRRGNIDRCIGEILITGVSLVLRRWLWQRTMHSLCLRRPESESLTKANVLWA